MLAAASFCPLFTPSIPALTFSAIKVAVYMDKDKANAISSGIMFNPPTKVKIVGESCFKTGYSKESVTPNNRNDINGNVKKLPTISLENHKLKIPNMGWFKLDLNNQFINNKFSNFVKSINKNTHYYFVHSFFVDPVEKNNIAATYSFGGHKIPAIVSKDNFIGCQFHPEKSGKKGLEIISNFLKLS